MSYIPAGAKWYVAELIEQITVSGDPRNILHKNLVLIRADSPEEAYERAFALGRENDDSYQNPAGQDVRVVFRGLGELVVIQDELDHGAELLYEEYIDIPNEEIEKAILPKSQLTVFRPRGARKLPDYSDREVVKDAIRVQRESSD